MKDDVELKEVWVLIEDMIGEERMQFQEDRVGEIVAISEMEADEDLGF
jgi:hypothetical protein